MKAGCNRSVIDKSLDLEKIVLRKYYFFLSDLQNWIFISLLDFQKLETKFSFSFWFMKFWRKDFPSLLDFPKICRNNFLSCLDVWDFTHYFTCELVKCSILLWELLDLFVFFYFFYFVKWKGISRKGLHWMGHGCPLFNCPHFKHRRNWCLVSLSSSFKDKQSPSRFFSLSSLGKPLVRILHVQTKFGRPNSASTPCEMRLVSFILYKHFLATAKT